MSGVANGGPACSLSLHRMRGEGWGEGLRASAQAAAPLIRPAATFSPPPRKGEGTRGSVLLTTRTRACSLSLHRMRGEGWGEGLRASAQAAPPLIRPAATFSPPPRKREGVLRESWVDCADGRFSLSAPIFVLRCFEWRKHAAEGVWARRDSLSPIGGEGWGEGARCTAVRAGEVFKPAFESTLESERGFSSHVHPLTLPSPPMGARVKAGVRTSSAFTHSSQRGTPIRANSWHSQANSFLT